MYPTPGRQYRFMRAEVHPDGRLRLIPKPDLAPGATDEAWWRAVMANPRPGRTANGWFNRYAADPLTVWPSLANIGVTNVYVECQNCPLRQVHKRADLIERFGADTLMVDLLGYLTADCEKLKSVARYSDPCGRRFARVYEWR